MSDDVLFGIATEATTRLEAAEAALAAEREKVARLRRVMEDEAGYLPPNSRKRVRAALDGGQAMSFDAEASRASMERIKRLEDVLAAVREKVAALEARVAILDKCVSRHVGIACDVAEREKVARLVALLGCAAELLDDEGCSEMADQLRRGALRETADDSGAAE